MVGLDNLLIGHCKGLDQSIPFLIAGGIDVDKINKLKH